MTEAAEKLGDVAAGAGIRRVHVVAWRDLDDAEAGGSELHAHEVVRRWAEAGIDVTFRTSVVAGASTHTRRDGYRVVRKTGRYLVFPRTAMSGLLGRDGERDALVEIWNGMPFFSPAWAGVPSVTWVHHVHAEMWQMMISPPLDRAGRLVELRLAPKVYRRSRLVTLSESSKTEIVDLLGLPPGRIDVVAPGVDERFTPGGVRADHPLVVAVGRLVPVKRFDALVDALVRLKGDHPALEAVIVGEGLERARLEARVAAAGAAGWLRLPGRLAADDLVDLYRRAWVLAAASQREGWGMTITEAAACATPAVATAVGGHRDAVVDGATGLLAPDVGSLAPLLDGLLRNRRRRERLGAHAATRAAALTWDRTARRNLELLAAEVAHRAR
jgi:glycosyltransferase involved in cell wall biosynthesis